MYCLDFGSILCFIKKKSLPQRQQLLTTLSCHRNFPNFYLWRIKKCDCYDHFFKSGSVSCFVVPTRAWGLVEM